MLFSHTQEYCNHQSRCVKCGENHISRECIKNKDSRVNCTFIVINHLQLTIEDAKSLKICNNSTKVFHLKQLFSRIEIKISIYCNTYFKNQTHQTETYYLINSNKDAETMHVKGYPKVILIQIQILKKSKKKYKSLNLTTFFIFEK